jgi:hypothetical protein
VGEAEALAILREQVPWLCEQLAADADAGRFGRWGVSTVVDENLGRPVLGDAAFRALHGLAGLAPAAPVGNAGVLHVYGYLLSLVETPYGLKRDRWTGGGVARALGLPSAAFTPWFDPAATPLARILDACLPRLDAPDSAADLRLWVDDRSGEGTDATIVRTVVIEHPGSVGGVLLYGTKVGAAALRLVTAFPVGVVTEDWLDQLLATPPGLRFNAALPGREPGSEFGVREVIVRA